LLQPYPLGTSVVQIDGGSIIAGSIQSASLKAGDITADRLNASSIQGSTLLIQSIVNGLNGGVAGSTRIDGGYIQTGTIAANKLVIQGGYSGCINVDPQNIDPSVWFAEVGAISIVEVDDAPVGRKVIRSAAGALTYVKDINYYAIDPSKTYRVRFWMRQVNANGLLYADLQQYVNNTGGTCANNGGRAPYKPAGQSLSSYGTGWTEISNQWGPADFQSGVKFVRLDWLLNYNGSAGYVEICNVRFEEMVTGSLVVDGSITSTHITTDGLTADVIKTGQLAAARLDINGVIAVVNGGSTTKITGTGIATQTLTTSHISTTGLDAGIIKTGSIVSQGTGTYQTFNSSNGTATGFKLSHDTFSTTNAWGRTQTGVQAEFGSTVMVKGFPLGPALGIPLSALDFPPLDTLSSSSRVFYRGNIDITTKGGVPDINCLSMKDFGDSTLDDYSWMRFGWRLQPQSASSNLDAMRYMRVKIYSSNGATLYDTMYVPLQDRLYASTTDSDASNAVYGDFMWGRRVPNPNTGSSPYPFTGCLKITIYNAYGPSDEKWFHGCSAVDTWYTDFSTPSGGSAPGSGGGTGGGGGGSRTGCVPAGTPYLTVNGVVPVETLQVGDWAIAYDNNTLQPIITRVNAVYRYEDREIFEVQTDRGSLVCSHDHRFARVEGVLDVSYPPARELVPGDLVYHRATNGSVETALVKAVTDLGYRDTVYHCTLEEGHVYVAGGFLAHNVVKIPTD
jgi:hypothetical protein